jgi:hypothetical protein
MKASPVSSRANCPKNDDAEIIEPVENSICGANGKPAAATLMLGWSSTPHHFRRKFLSNLDSPKR